MECFFRIFVWQVWQLLVFFDRVSVETYYGEYWSAISYDISQLLHIFSLGTMKDRSVVWWRRHQDAPCPAIWSCSSCCI